MYEMYGRFKPNVANKVNTSEGNNKIHFHGMVSVAALSRNKWGDCGIECPFVI